MVSESIIKKNIGPPLKEVLAILVPTASEEDIDRLATLYREYFSSAGLYELEFYDGIPEMLECLSQENVRLFVLSSKPTVFIERILERYAYREYFTEIDGVSLEYNNKTKMERLKDRIRNEGLDPAECVVVGDRAEDMNAARHCGTEFIGILFGYGNETELKGSVIIENVEELKNLLVAWISQS
jgi:phosphoglycolate phosphatase